MRKRNQARMSAGRVTPYVIGKAKFDARIRAVVRIIWLRDMETLTATKEPIGYVQQVQKDEPGHNWAAPPWRAFMITIASRRDVEAFELEPHRDKADPTGTCFRTRALGVGAIWQHYEHAVKKLRKELAANG